MGPKEMALEFPDKTDLGVFLSNVAESMRDTFDSIRPATLLPTIGSHFLCLSIKHVPLGVWEEDFLSQLLSLWGFYKLGYRD